MYLPAAGLTWSGLLARAYLVAAYLAVPSRAWLRLGGGGCTRPRPVVPVCGQMTLTVAESAQVRAPW